MPRRCSICAHPERDAIDAALIAGIGSIRSIAPLYSVSLTALLRHRDAHLPETLVHAHESAEVTRAEDLLAQVRALEEKAVAILHRAEAAGDLRSAVAAIRESRGCI